MGTTLCTRLLINGRTTSSDSSVSMSVESTLRFRRTDSLDSESPKPKPFCICVSSVLICGSEKVVRNKMRKSFESSRAPEPVGAFPHAKRVGEFLFLSGIGPRVRGRKKIPGVTLDSAGKIVSYDIETQCRAVFENVRLVLEDAGATWQDIIDVTVFLTNMKKDFPIYNKLYAEFFAGPGKPNPTRTTIEVGALPTPIAIELKVIAAVG